MKSLSWMLGLLLAQGVGCAKGTQDAPIPVTTHAAAPVANPPASSPEDVRISGSAPPAPQAPDASAGGKASEVACVDGWLTDHHLDPYGNPPGTAYAGGTPLFDEQTGQTRDRLGYIYARQPGAKKACAPSAP